MKIRMWMLVLTVGGMMLSGCFAQAGDLVIRSLESTGELTFRTRFDGTNYNYQVEWAPTAAGPWSTFTGADGWLDNVTAASGTTVRCSVPMCYRIVATRGDYLVVDISGGTNATEYTVTYYRTLADLPGDVGVNSDSYKTTNMVFRRIPAGTFTMGSPVDELGRRSDETQYRVTLTQPFYLGVFEVTQKQWERVMGTWPSYFTNTSYRDCRPVEQVSYYQIRENPGNSDDPTVNWPVNSAVNAQSFMGRLRARTGMAFDLPTESQWEYAGRAGTTTALNSGKNLTSANICTNVAEVGRCRDNGGAGYTRNGDTSVGSAKVGSYLPNQWGLYDIHGNVWEWCLDWHGDYPPGPVSDPPGVSAGSTRAIRSGAWSPVEAYNFRAGLRTEGVPSVANNWSIGFRVALPAGQ